MSSLTLKEYIIIMYVCMISMVTEEYTGVDGPSDDPPEGVPCSVVKPVVEAVEAFLGQELGRSEVEVGIKLVDHALETQYRKQSSGER